MLFSRALNSWEFLIRRVLFRTTPLTKNIELWLRERRYIKRTAELQDYRTKVNDSRDRAKYNVPLHVYTPYVQIE